MFTAYLLTQAVIIPIYGRLADIYGRRRMLLIATGVFVLGSILCGCAWNMLSLILFRVVQGIGAGGLVPVSQTVIGDLYSPVERARISGYLSSCWAIGSIIGPLLGAFLIAHTIWPMVFWINVPIAAAAALMLVLWLKEGLEHRVRRIDYGGAALMVAANTVLMVAVVEFGALGLLPSLALVMLSILLFALFFRLERRAAEPMLPVELLKNRTLAAASLGCFASGAILMGATAFVSLYVQGVMGESAFIAGLVLTTPSITWVIGSASGGWLMLRSSYRSTTIAGGTLLVAGGIVMVLLRPGIAPWVAGLGVGLIGIGMGTGLLEPGEVGISATNRNFKGRMGAKDAQCYLASPEVVAASAVADWSKVVAVDLTLQMTGLDRVDGAPLQQTLRSVVAIRSRAP